MSVHLDAKRFSTSALVGAAVLLVALMTVFALPAHAKRGSIPVLVQATSITSGDIQRPKLRSERAETIGALFETMLRNRLAGPFLREIRRAGLLLGLQMDNAATVEAFITQCRREHLIVGWTLHDDTVVRLAPPLVISEDELDEATRRMQHALARVSPPSTNSSSRHE